MFEVGDKVRIIAQRQDLMYDHAHPGDTGMVLGSQKDNRRVEIDRTGDNWWFRDSELAPATFGDTMDEGNKLASLKVGQWVEVVKDGRKGPIKVIEDDGYYLTDDDDTCQWGAFTADELRVMSSEELAVAKKADDAITLSPDDPFEAVLIDIVKTNRAKRADYAHDGDIFSNFREAGQACGVDAADIVEMHIATKNARLRALKANGREPENEAVADTLLDRAVYSVIRVCLDREA